MNNEWPCTTKWKTSLVTFKKPKQRRDKKQQTRNKEKQKPNSRGTNTSRLPARPGSVAEAARASERASSARKVLEDWFGHVSRRTFPRELQIERDEEGTRKGEEKKGRE